MTFTTDGLRRLSNFYGLGTLDYVLKWGDEAMSIGRPVGHGRWVDRDGKVRPARNTFEVWDPNDAVLILRPERRKVKVQQVVFTPTTDKPRLLEAGQWYESGDSMYYLDTPSITERVPFRRTVVEVEIEVEEDAP